MEQSISNSSKYSIFDFSKAFVNKDKSKCLKILEHLRVEGTPETIVLSSSPFPSLTVTVNTSVPSKSSGAENVIVVPITSHVILPTSVHE